MSNKYRLDTPALLSYVRLRNGTPVTGLTVTVVVLNATTGAQLLASTACPEVTSGVYSYSWTHGRTVFTECLAKFTIGNESYYDNFIIDDSLSIDESSDSNAV